MYNYNYKVDARKNKYFWEEQNGYIDIGLVKTFDDANCSIFISSFCTSMFNLYEIYRTNF